MVNWPANPLVLTHSKKDLLFILIVFIAFLVLCLFTGLSFFNLLPGNKLIAALIIISVAALFYSFVYFLWYKNANLAVGLFIIIALGGYGFLAGDSFNILMFGLMVLTSSVLLYYFIRTFILCFFPNYLKITREGVSMRVFSPKVTPSAIFRIRKYFFSCEIIKNISYHEDINVFQKGDTPSDSVLKIELINTPKSTEIENEIKKLSLDNLVYPYNQELVENTNPPSGSLFTGFEVDPKIYKPIYDPTEPTQGFVIRIAPKFLPSLGPKEYKDFKQQISALGVDKQP